MAEITTLREAIAALVRDGDLVAMEGFTHLIPFAAGHEVIRQRRRNLTLVRMTPDVIYDQLIGAGCAKKLIFSWGGNPGVGSLHRLRDAVEHDWPAPLEIQEHGHGDLSNAYVAGASNLPFAVLRAYAGSDLPKYNEETRTIVHEGKEIEAPEGTKYETDAGELYILHHPRTIEVKGGWKKMRKQSDNGAAPAAQAAPRKR